jgi:lipid-A-disaccharide synthase
MKSNDSTPIFPPPDGGVDILIIAGEHSGDQHAARLIEGMLRRDPSLHIAAIGGPKMREAGARLLYDLTAFGVVGFVEVLRHLGQLRQLLDGSVDWIAAHKPRAVCFVDYPGFNLNLAGRLHKQGIAAKAGGPTRLLYYISPQIWAWKAGRRFKMARLLDAMAVIFPFETSCYADTQLPVSFVGHPFVSDRADNPFSYDSGGPVLLLPGSRVQAVGRIFPLMLAAYAVFIKGHPERRAVVLFPDEAVKRVLEKHLAASKLPAGTVQIVPASTKIHASACLTSSGTISLSCALAAIPGAICYRAHPLTYVIGRALVKLSHIGIANLLLPDGPPYREYIQSAATPEALAADLADAIESPARAAHCAESADKLRALLSPGQSQGPDEWLLAHVRCG